MVQFLQYFAIIIFRYVNLSVINGLVGGRMVRSLQNNWYFLVWRFFYWNSSIHRWDFDAYLKNPTIHPDKCVRLGLEWRLLHLVLGLSQKIDCISWKFSRTDSHPKQLCNAASNRLQMDVSGPRMFFGQVLCMFCCILAIFKVGSFLFGRLELELSSILVLECWLNLEVQWNSKNFHS